MMIQRTLGKRTGALCLAALLATTALAAPARASAPTVIKPSSTNAASDKTEESASTATKKSSSTATKSSSKATVQSQAKKLLSHINEEREKVGAEPLKFTASLQKAAKIRAEEAVVKFSHTRPDGSAYNTVFAEVGQTKEYYSAENISAGRSDPAKVCEGWMESKGHRENMLNSIYTTAGIYHVKSTDSKYSDYWVLVLQG